MDVLDPDGFESALAPVDDSAPARIQPGVISGHKADFSVMVMDPDPIKVESVNQQILASTLGQAIVPMWSYVSITEISEYVQSVDQYRQRLVRSGEDPGGTAIETKVEAYAKRLVKMNYQRLTPEFPGAEYPASCFYPMNKWRYPGANWFTLSSSERNKLMSEHARSGMKFAGEGEAIDLGRRRLGRLGMGSNTLGNESASFKADRVRHAFRRSKRQVCRIRSVLHKLSRNPDANSGNLPDRLTRQYMIFATTI